MDPHVVGWVLLPLLLLGVSTPFWSAVGLVRVVRSLGPSASSNPSPDRSAVAVLIAAHDEALVLQSTLRSASRQVPRAHVFVASDGSTDDTVRIARDFGAEVLDLQPNRGKAGALAAAIEHFELARHFEVVLLLDADTVLADDYLDTGLPLFADEEVVAVAGTAATNRDGVPEGLIGRVLVAYRERVYVVVQYLQKFGQAAKGANVVAIVPGFASMYRARVLRDIDITAPGLVIEDFNMTFEIHAKRLGRIAFRPGTATAYTQDPDTLTEYRRQVRRWSLGFWQTLRRHRTRADRFWSALLVSTSELVVGSVVFVLLGPAVLVSTIASLLALSGSAPQITGDLTRDLPTGVLLLGGVVPDYLLTLVAAVVLRRPSFLLLGVLFPLVRLIDAVECLACFASVLRYDSDGSWTSPTRRAVVQGEVTSIRVSSRSE